MTALRSPPTRSRNTVAGLRLPGPGRADGGPGIGRADAAPALPGADAGDLPAAPRHPLGAAPPVQVVAPAGQRRRPRPWVLCLSAVLHLGALALALDRATGALAPGGAGVMEVTLVASSAAMAPAAHRWQAAPAEPRPVRDAAAPPPRLSAGQRPVAAAAPPAPPWAPQAEAPAQELSRPVRLRAPAPGPAPVLAPPDPAGEAAPALPAPTAEVAPTPPNPSVRALVAPSRTAAPRVAPDAPPQAAHLPPPLRPAPRPTPHPTPRAEPQRQAPAPTARRAAPATEARGRGDGLTAGDGGTARAGQTGNGAARALIAEWGARITGGVERAKHYPLAAGGAGGEVALVLGVAPDGRLLAASVRRSSGNAALDLAALQAVRAAAPFARAPVGLSGARYDFGIRIGFRP